MRNRHRLISDGFSDYCLCDRPECGLEVVRPGKVQCWCDSGPGAAFSGDDGITYEDVRGDR